MNEFLTFRKFITPMVIQVLFWIGVVGVVIGGLVMIFQGGAGVIMGLLYIILGPIFVRIYMEVLIIIFRLFDSVHHIELALAGGTQPAVPAAPMGGSFSPAAPARPPIVTPPAAGTVPPTTPTSPAGSPPPAPPPPLAQPLQPQPLTPAPAQAAPPTPPPAEPAPPESPTPPPPPPVS